MKFLRGRNAFSMLGMGLALASFVGCSRTQKARV